MADKYRHVPQYGRDRSSGKRLTCLKDYLDAHFNLLGILGVSPRDSGVIFPNRQAIIFEKIVGSVLNNKFRAAGIKVSNIETVKSEAGSNRHDEFVLIGNIKEMETIQQVIPVRIRLKVAEFLSDFFAGDLYLSIFKNTFKTLRFPTERKLDFVGGWVERSKDIPGKMVQRGSQIVDRIADNQREMIGDGRIYLCDQGALAAISVVLNGKPASVGIVKSFRLGNKILDMMLGPL